MVFKQILDNCFDSRIGRHGVSKSQVDSAIEQIKTEIDGLKKQDLKLFDFADIEEKTRNISEFTKKISKNFKDIFILGTGGATLCGQTICGLLENNKKISSVNFIDNIDPKTFQFLLEKINVNESFVMVISKSGGTLETITQFAFFVEIYEKKLGIDSVKKHFAVITDVDNEPNIIRNIAGKLSIEIVPHEKVGGRFSIFTPVALIPASFAGIDINSFLKGAKTELDKTFVQKDSDAIKGAALNYTLIEHKNSTATVMMPYVDRLKNFTTWFAQIWAESLGKIEKASTPIRSLGTLDQHSQMQLYLEGRKDKFFNVMYIKENGNEDELKIKLNKYFKDENLNYIDNKNFSNVINSAAKATIETLVKNGNPVRVFEIDKLDEFTLGALSMHFILETVLLAQIWKINPFDQPAVEAGKKLTVEMLRA